jgi:DNA topoisomerase III
VRSVETSTLILTEKPSVARDFAKALGLKVRGEGFLEGPDLVVTWAIGHLLELKEPEDYDPRWKRWHLSDLPILPDVFGYKPIEKNRRQLEVIRRLLGRGPDRVVIATDAGREGEVIARTILMAVGFDRMDRVGRFWTSQALTEQVIRETMGRIAPIASYDRLWHAGQARQIADWLVGMNATRAATVRMGDLFSVGRVQTAVLALLVDRRRERERFKAAPYWLLRACFTNERGSWWGLWFKGEETRLSTEAEATRALGKVLEKTGQVTMVKRQRRCEPPPLLYSLTDLQQDANRRFGLTAKATLGIAQALYEKRKCLSYPRSDARVLGTKNVGLARDLVRDLAPAYPEIFAGVATERISGANTRVFNDARLTDHHALIPLKPLAAGATENEARVYDLVLRRFAAVFHGDCVLRQSEIITEVARETFRTQGREILDAGWRMLYAAERRPGGAAEDPEDMSQPLPGLVEKGDPARVTEGGAQKKTTQPPPDYTDALLLREMTNPGRYVSESQLKKIYRGDVGLGTQATRAQIIETLLDRTYLIRRKKHLLATDKGCRLVDTLRGFKTGRVLTSPEETARWEMTLEAVARGEGTADPFLGEIRSLVKTIVTEFMEAAYPMDNSVIGKCPACGGEVTEGNKGFGCANWRDQDGGCRFVIWKTIARRPISPETATELLRDGKTPLLSGFISKKEKPFSAGLVLAHQEGQWRVVLDFNAAPAPQAPAKSIGKCPACGGRIIEGKRGFGCANWREKDGACRFVIWKTIAGREIPEEVATELLSAGRVGPLSGFISKEGKPFSARLRIRSDDAGLCSVGFDFDDTRA